MKNSIRLSDHFTYKKLLRFTVPSIVMMVFTSIYGVVDGFFISNFSGKTAFAAVNFIIPFVFVLGTVGFMFGTGGSAVVAKTLGQGEKKKANELFSLFVYVAFIIGILISLLGLLFLRPVTSFLGAEGELLEECVRYGRIIIAANPAFVLQMLFQSFFIAAEKPKLGLYSTVLAGCTNMVLDALLVAVFPLGVTGAALAIGISQIVGGVFPIIYFSLPNTSLFRLGKTHWDGRAVWKTCTNGSSELMSNISMNLVSILYNIQLLKFAGEDGVSAYGVLMYVGFIFVAIFIGFSIGSAPVISFHFGAENHNELKSLLKKSCIFIAWTSLGMFIISQLLAVPLSSLFVGYDKALLEMTVRGFRFNAFSFLFSGFAIFSSGFFTALNDGVTSALISFLRTMLFQIASVMLLPLVFRLDGIWSSLIVSEAMSVILALIFLVKKRDYYHY
ncbi:MAG: MATE family efflux transporter [Clostridia bacterium]|nr:MATE family efflux transporter [Clostridia bacterium]